MWNKKSLATIAVLCLALLGGSLGVAFAEKGGFLGIDAFNHKAPMPRLLSPALEKVNLKGANDLEFKWSSHEGLINSFSYYDFRLYEGRDAIESRRILKKRIELGSHSINLKSDLFKDGAVYTWTLQTIYRDAKSEKAYDSFVVEK